MLGAAGVRQACVVVGVVVSSVFATSLPAVEPFSAQAGVMFFVAHLAMVLGRAL